MADSGKKSTERRDPLAGFCFKVTFTDVKDIVGSAVVETYFRSVSGLRAENEVVPLRAGGVNDTVFNLVGGVKWAPLVFKQGFTKDSALLKWREMWTQQGEKRRSGGTIVQLDSTLTVAQAEWTFVRGWPSKWELTEFDASKSELSIETLEICHEGLKYSPK